VIQPFQGCAASFLRLKFNALGLYSHKERKSEKPTMKFAARKTLQN